MDEDMAKLTVIIDEDLNERLRRYIYDAFPPPASPYGKLKEVTVKALEKYLSSKGY